MRHPLWNEPPADDSDMTRSYLVMPSSDDPRWVLPTRPHRAAATILHALRSSATPKSMAQSALLRSATISGLRTTHLPQPPFLAVLAEQLGGTADDYVIGVHLGPARANRKPVVALSDRSGQLVGFAKLGLNPLTDHLVSHEVDALPLIQGLPGVTVPQLLGSGRYQGHPFVVQSPVPTSSAPFRGWFKGRYATSDRVTAAQVVVAAVGGDEIDVAECLRHVAEKWRARQAHAASSADVAAFAELAGQWCEAMGRCHVPWGSWHGDWRETNMAISDDGCSVWDWERFATGVPVGYDALHHFLTSRATSVNDLSTLSDDVREHAARLLRPFGISRRGDVELVTTGYFLELAGRYLDDGQAQSGARLGDVGQWLLPHLQRHAPLGASSDDVQVGRGEASL